MKLFYPSIPLLRVGFTSGRPLTEESIEPLFGVNERGLLNRVELIKAIVGDLVKDRNLKRPMIVCGFI